MGTILYPLRFGGQESEGKGEGESMDTGATMYICGVGVGEAERHYFPVMGLQMDN